MYIQIVLRLVKVEANLLQSIVAKEMGMGSAADFEKRVSKGFHALARSVHLETTERGSGSPPATSSSPTYFTSVPGAETPLEQAGLTAPHEAWLNRRPASYRRHYERQQHLATALAFILGGAGFLAVWGWCIVGPTNGLMQRFGLALGWFPAGWVGLVAGIIGFGIGQYLYAALTGRRVK